MRGKLTLVALATLTAALMFGCTDDDNGSANNGGSSNAGASGNSNNGGSGGGALAHCVGSNAAFTPSQYSAQSTSGKACTDAADIGIVCSNDVSTLAATCGKSCLNMGDNAAQAKCVAGCIDDSTTPDLSSACMACYTTDVECARTNCLIVCGLNPTGSDCASCRVEHGCAPDFYECSGLPSPLGPSGEGGAGGTANAGAGGADERAGVGGADERAGAGGADERAGAGGA